MFGISKQLVDEKLDDSGVAAKSAEKAKTAGRRLLNVFDLLWPGLLVLFKVN